MLNSVGAGRRQAGRAIAWQVGATLLVALACLWQGLAWSVAALVGGGAVLPAMMAQTSGRILVVGSFADIAPIPDSSAYSASKGALHALVKAINAELAGDFPDILVNEWVPGALNTGMGIPAGLDPELAAGWGLDIAATGAGGPSGSIYVGNQLQVAPVSLKRRIVGKLLGR